MESVQICPEPEFVELKQRQTPSYLVEMVMTENTRVVADLVQGCSIADFLFITETFLFITKS